MIEINKLTMTVFVVIWNEFDKNKMSVHTDVEIFQSQEEATAKAQEIMNVFMLENEVEDAPVENEDNSYQVSAADKELYVLVCKKKYEYSIEDGMPGEFTSQQTSMYSCKYQTNYYLKDRSIHTG